MYLEFSKIVWEWKEDLDYGIRMFYLLKWFLELKMEVRRMAINQMNVTLAGKPLATMAIGCMR